MLQSNSVILIRTLACLIMEIAHQARDMIDLSFSEDQALKLTLGWSGPGLEPEQLNRWREQRLMAASGAPTIAESVSHMGLQLVFDAGQAVISLPRAPDLTDMVPMPGTRPEFYDFNLIRRGASDMPSDFAQRPLAELTTVVFDTETTGLEPSRGDSLVQIAGQRIVAGRILQGDVFDTLVDPERRIPAVSTAIHKITEEMVRGAPTAAQAVSRFHGFVEGAVLVAHNAPFDMAFLSKAAAAANIVFEHPVLDTVLLSAIAFPHETDHTLDGLAMRLSVTIPEPLRHTALGDARATAEVYLKLIAFLAEQGIVTLADAEAASAKMFNLRRQQAKYT